MKISGKSEGTGYLLATVEFLRHDRGGFRRGPELRLSLEWLGESHRLFRKADYNRRALDHDKEP